MSHATDHSEAVVLGREPITLRQATRALAFVVLYVAAVVGGLVAVGLSDLVELTLQGFLPLFLGFVTVAAMLALYVHLVRRNNLTFAGLGFRRPGLRFLHLLWQIPAAILAAAVIQGIFVTVLISAGLDPEAARSTNDPLEELVALPTHLVIIVILAVAVATPVWEEVLFRGAFLDGFSRRFRPWPAIVLSAALFAVVHLVAVGFVYLFSIGVALALVRRFHGNLWAPIVLHAVNNGLVVVFILTAV